MKYLATILIALTLASGAAFGQDRLDAASPKDPRTMAMGGAFVAMSQGYQNFFGNPAGFAGKREFTLSSVNSWVYISPTTDNIAMFSDAISSGDVSLGSLGELITTNGLGAGMSFGTGLTGGGLGLGVVGGFDAYVRGRSAVGASGTMDGQLAAIVGIGLPLRLFGLDLSVGGNLRPFLRMSGPIEATELLGLLGDDEVDPMTMRVDVGFGLAADLGLKLNFGRLASVGLAVRDISTDQIFAISNLGDTLDSLGTGNLPPGDEITYTVLPNIALGVSLRPLPAAISRLIDVLIIAELQDIPTVVADEKSFMHMVHLGTEVDLLSGFIALRGGLNKGYISLGAGMDLAILEFNIAVFTEELGVLLGDKPRTGVSAEFAIRF
ncbi:MAG: hypothetical protein A3J97_10310 [Spirochaetes bacterium RIFOXYC1_FULL_54_7]|nr:MAG: hypothetical protein A3J97_10310 [Spirochaetes bacterium RIFOXYC1_FULL_54_7]